MLFKICKSCNTEKPISEFHNHKKGKYGKCGSCKVCRSKKQKAYYRANREEVKRKSRIRIENRDPEKRKASRQAYEERHRDRRNAAKRKQDRQRRLEDPNYKLRKNLRSRLSDAVRGRGKGGSAVKDLGCTVEDLIKYLKSKFEPGMSMENYGWGKGKWNIDHIIPLSKFDLTKPEQARKALHYTNLRPLWFEDNLAKSNKIRKSVKDEPL